MTEVDVALVSTTERPLTIAEPAQGTQFSGSRYLFRQAAREFGVELDDQEDKDWRALLGGAYLVDHLLDIEKEDIMPKLKMIISGELIEGLHPDTQIRFRNYMLGRNDEQYEDIMSRLEQVNSLAQRQALAETPQEIIEVRSKEADLLAYLLALPTKGREDIVARQRFNTWLNGWSRSGYFFDTLVDMKLDYANGDSGVQPTLRAKTAIAKVAIKEALIAARKTPIKLLGRCALAASKYVLLNNKPDMTNLTRDL